MNGIPKTKPRFIFERRGIKYMFCLPDDDTDDVRLYREGGTFYTVSDAVDATGIRAMLALNTEREKIFAEAMTLLDECVDRIGDDAAAIEVQAKSLAARWQATTSGNAILTSLDPQPAKPSEKEPQP